MNLETQHTVQYLNVDSNTMRIVNGRKGLYKGGEKSILKTVGGHLKEGWKTMKEEAVKINRRIKESKFGEKIEIVKTSQFTKRVKDAAKQAGKAIKKGTKKATEQIKSFTKQDTTTIKVDQVAIAYISCCKQPN